MSFQSDKAKYLREAAEEARVKADCAQHPSAKRIFDDIAENYDTCADQWDEACHYRARLANQTK